MSCSGRMLSTIVIYCTGKAELARDEPGYPAKAISKQVLKTLPGFFLLPVVKCERREIN